MSNPQTSPSNRPVPVPDKEKLEPETVILPEISEELAAIIYDIVKQEAAIKEKRETIIKTVHVALNVDAKKYRIDHDQNMNKLKFVPIPGAE